MRCRVCNRAVQDYLLSRKLPNGEYEDLCAACIKYNANLVEELVNLKNPDPFDLTFFKPNGQ